MFTYKYTSPPLNLPVRNELLLFLYKYYSSCRVVLLFAVKLEKMNAKNYVNNDNFIYYPYFLIQAITHVPSFNVKNLKVSWYRPTSTSTQPISSPVSLKIPIGTSQEQADTVNSSQIYRLLQLESPTDVATVGCAVQSTRTHIAPHGSASDSHRSHIQSIIRTLQYCSTRFRLNNIV